MSGVKHLFSGFDNASDRNLAYHDINLYLGEKVGFHRNTAVILGLSSLHAVSENMGYRHTGNSKFLHGCLKGIEAVLFAYDFDLCKLGTFTLVKGRNLFDRYCLCNGNICGG